MSDEITKTLLARNKTHGDFRTQGDIAQWMKDCVREYPHKWRGMQSYKRDAIDMILSKISRIVAGDSDHEDHWVDIAGYANLVIRAIEKEDKELGGG